MAVYTVATVKGKDLKTTLDAVDAGGKTLVSIMQAGSNLYTVVSKT